MADGGGVFAAEAAARTLKYFEDYHGIEYELPKIDSAAIPGTSFSEKVVIRFMKV